MSNDLLFLIRAARQTRDRMKRDAAFAAILCRSDLVIRRLIARFGWDDQADAYSHAMEAVLHAVNTYREPHSFDAYVFRIVRFRLCSRAREIYRRRRREGRRLYIDTADRGDECNDWLAIDDATTERPKIETDEEARERAGAVNEALDRIRPSPLERAAARLVIGKSIPYEQAAQIIKRRRWARGRRIDAGTIDNALQRFRRKAAGARESEMQPCQS